MTRALVLATRNAHKVEELRQLLAEVPALAGVEVLSAADFPDVPDVPETEVTFEGNSALKALALARATGLPAVADDSGLAVDVLGGSPGVFSARWSGSTAGPDAPRAVKDRANLGLLLEQLADVPPQHRGAAFRCAVVLALPDGSTYAAHGQVRGSLEHAPRGENGFGYDPIFVPDAQSGERVRTFAEHTDAEKNAMSHRGEAFRALVPTLVAQLGPHGGVPGTQGA